MAVEGQRTNWVYAGIGCALVITLGAGFLAEPPCDYVGSSAGSDHRQQRTGQTAAGENVDCGATGTDGGLG